MVKMAVRGFKLNEIVFLHHLVKRRANEWKENPGRRDAKACQP